MSKKGCKWNNCPNYATTYVDMGNRQVPACGGCKRGSMTPNPQANRIPELEEKILEELYSDCEMCMGYSGIYHLAEMPELRKAIKHLRELEYIEYYRGLMTEDGEVCGSGWCRSNLGNKYVEEHQL